MGDTGFLIIIGLFVFYYLLVLFTEKKLIRDPSDILSKFLATILLYAGISLVYFSVTGKPFFGDSIETYNIYIFIIGFMALLWTIPELLEEFSFFQNFFNKKEKNKMKLLKKKN